MFTNVFGTNDSKQSNAPLYKVFVKIRTGCYITVFLFGVDQICAPLSYKIDDDAILGYFSLSNTSCDKSNSLSVTDEL